MSAISDDLPNDAIARLRLIRSANIGPVSYRQLIARFGTAAAAIEALPQLAARGGARTVRIAPAALAEAELDRVASLGARPVFLGTAAYPPALAQLDSAPPVLIASGDLAMLDRPCVAIIGARNASAAACRHARQLAGELADAGVTIVSGLARGIDTAAHVGALQGRTAGVIASGIDIAFPRENERLQAEMAARQLVVTEHSPGTEPMARHFPARNRIIAGLCAATVVVEAAYRSGSLITARLAAEAGREVLAIPGSPLDPRARGCNQLIRDGATLVQDAADILEAVRPFDARMTARAPSRVAAGAPDLFIAGSGEEADGDARARITSLLGPTGVSIDELARQSGASVAAIQLVLLELELAGRLDHQPGNKVALALDGRADH